MSFRLVLTLFSTVGVSIASAHGQHVLWLETEQFDESGGWVNDAQFIDQMGSPYLLANGMGEPVKDATTRVTLPAAGTYRLWARTKDWVPEHHPGRFQILLNGRTSAMTFGQSGQPGWRWENGGVHQLADTAELRLRDLTGYYGRCDAVVLTNDLDWAPPTETAAVATLRETHGGQSPQVEQIPHHDVVVIGGGLAGCTAAVAAARRGVKTALIQNRPLLGGNASTEILVPPVGVSPGAYRRRYPLDPAETGLIEEYRTAGNQRVTEGKLYSKRLLRFVQLEPNLDLFLNTHATGVVMPPRSEHKIAAVLAVHVRTGQRMRFPGTIFIDCTGDAVVGVAAGAEYRHGKEPKSLSNEPWAPEVASKHTMGNGLKYFAQDTGSPQSFERAPWAFSFPTCESFGPGRHPRLPRGVNIGYQWINELGGTRDTYADAEEIRDDLLRLIHGLWNHTKNCCPQYDLKAANHKLVWVGHVAGKRENRRLMGDYVLTQNDIGDQTLFRDRVALGGWIVDDHYSEGFFHKGSFGIHYDDPDHAYAGQAYSIPFRCLYSKNVENLMMAGRDISATHLALANTRVMLTCAVIGHAAGTGAALCVEQDTSPRGLCNDHIETLQQQLLKEGASLIDVPNNDPRDLARQAGVAASSEQTRLGGEVMAAKNVLNGYAKATGDGETMVTNAWAPQLGGPGPHWVELAWNVPVAFNMVHVSFQTAEMAPERFAIEVRLDGEWAQLAEVADNRHRRHVLGLDRTTTSKLRVVLEQPAAICEIRVYDEPQRMVDIARRAQANMRLPDQGPWLPWDERRRSQQYGGIVIDADDVRQTGVWVHSTWSEPYVYDGYLHDGNAGKGTKSISFQPAQAKPGRYEVRLAYVAAANRATNTPVTVHSVEGTTTIHVNQRLQPPIDGLFFSLGAFAWDAESRIMVSNAGTDGYVVVDAVQLIPLD